MVADIERMNAMTEQVLDYARGELEPTSMQTLDMAAPLDECIQSARLRGVDFHSGLAGPLPWHGDALMQPFQRGMKARATAPPAGPVWGLRWSRARYASAEVSSRCWTGRAAG